MSGMQRSHTYLKIRNILLVFLLSLFIQPLHAQFSIRDYDCIEKLTEGVKSIFAEYTSITDKGKTRLTKFIYDNQNRLHNIIVYDGADSTRIINATRFIYDGHGYLSKKIIYDTSSSPPHGIRTQLVIEYRNGKKVSQKDYFPSGNLKSEAKFEYKNGQLVSQLIYSTGYLRFKSIFDYEDKRIIRETRTGANADTQNVVKYVYSKDTLTEIQYCNHQGYPIRRTFFSYNKQGKISTAAIRPNWVISTGSSYNEKYEY
jgi:antitoxin component YwqK of YwqJK toxin-antitoxin module